MLIHPQQLVNPGVYDHSDQYFKQLERFNEAVRRARFLSEKERRHWRLLGSILGFDQLKKVEQMIIDEDLRILSHRHQLEKIKSNIKKSN